MERVTRIEMLIDMLKEDANDVFLNFALGLEYSSDLNTVTEAERLFRFVLDNNEKYLAAYYQLGKLFESTNRKTEAIAMFQKGLEKARDLRDNKATNEFGEAIFLLED